MIPVKCPGCDHVLQVPDQFAGSDGNCKKCGAKVSVPLLVSPSQSATSETADAREISRPAPKKKKWRGKVALALCVAAMTVFAVGFALVDKPKVTQPISGKPISGETTKQPLPSNNATISPKPSTNITPAVPVSKSTQVPVASVATALVEGEVYQVTRPTPYVYLDPWTGKYAYGDPKIIPVNGYFTVTEKLPTCFLVSLSDGVNVFQGRVRNSELEQQKLNHIDKNTITAWQRQQEEAVRRENERLAREESQRRIDEAKAIAIEKVAIAQQEKEQAEAEAAQRQSELAQAQIMAAQAETQRAMIQAQAIAAEQERQYYLDQQVLQHNEQVRQYNNQVLWNRAKYDGVRIIRGGQVINP